MSLSAQKKIKVFFSYSHIDEKLRDKLAEHLSQLKRIEIISDWHDRNMSGGKDVHGEISENLNSADIILLLISSSFIASDYCYKKEMPRAMERYNSGEARVIPVILRPCDWSDSPFVDLNTLPKDSKPVTKWDDEDDAFLDIAQAIRKVVKELQAVEPQIPELETEEKKIPKISVTIPTPIVSFVQRHDRDNNNFIEKVEQSLAESENRTVVLWGYGGVGKTTLAAQIARLSEGKKQVVWISADGRTEISSEILLDEIVTQLGQPEIRQLPPTMKHKQTLSLLNETPSIIILDNFETLKPEFQLDCLEFLKTKDFESLITTRDKIDRFRNMNVFEMTEAEADAYLTRLIEDSTFPNAFIEEIRKKTIETAERNPLIMQWIVGQIDAAESPKEVFEELQHGEGYAAERVFDRSFNLPQLGNDGRNILLALSLFALSARRKSVRGVVNLDKDNKRFNKGLKSLANLRLINVTDGSERIFLGGLTRQFAGAYLIRKDSYKSYYRRFIQYFENFARIHAKPNSDNLNHLEDEKVNFFTAIDLAFELEDWKNAFSISQNLADFLRIRGHWTEIISNSTKMLNLSKKFNNRRDEAYFIHFIGVTYSDQGKMEKAEKMFNESLNIYRSLNDQVNIAHAINNLGITAKERGEINKARQLYNESLEIRKRLKDYSGIAHSKNSLGVLAQINGEIDKAEELFNESLEIRRKIGNFSEIAESLDNLGVLATIAGKQEKAEQLYNESIEIKRKLGEKSGMAESFNKIGRILANKGDIEKAEALYNESLKISRKIGNHSNTAYSFHNLANLASDKGDIEKAEQFYNQSLEIYRKLGDKAGISSLLNSFGELNFLKGELDESEKYCHESLEISEKLGHIELINETKRLLGQIFQSRGDLTTAEDYYRESLDIFRKIGYQEQIALTLKEFASLVEINGDKNKVIEYLEEALEFFERINSPKVVEVRADLERLKGSSD